MRVTWDGIGEHYYKAGVDRGVLYTEFGGNYVSGVPWNGLLSVDPKHTRNKSDLYSGDVKREHLFSSPEFGGTIKALTYPEEFEECQGNYELLPGLRVGQQERDSFGLSFRTVIGNDTSGNSYAYQLTLVYAAHVTDVNESYSTIDSSMKPSEFSWGFDTIPIESTFDDVEPYAVVEIDSSHYSAEIMEELEDILYGTDDTSPRLPYIEEIYSILVRDPDSDYAMWDGYPYPTRDVGRELYPETVIETEEEPEEEPVVEPEEEEEETP